MTDGSAPADRKHSRFAPSSLKRVLVCPRSVALSEALPPGKSSVYAAEGSVAHTVGEAYLRIEISWLGGCFDDPGNYDATAAAKPLLPGKVVQHEGYSITIDGDMHCYAREYRDYVRGLMKPDSKLFVETTVRLDEVVGPEADMYGHLDAAVWTPSEHTLDVIDYKYGRGVPVSPLDNPQLKAYGLGALFSLPEIDPDTVNYVRTHVVQPRVPGPKLPPDIIPTVDLLRWGYEEVEPVLSLIRKDGAIGTDYVTGEHCRFCPALAICPAMRDRATKAAQKAFGADLKRKPENLTDDELADLLDELDVVEPLFAAAAGEALLRAERGSNIRGRKLVASRGKRVWIDEDEAARALSDKFGLTHKDIFTKPELRSVAQIEREITDRRARPKFNELWTMKSSGFALAKQTDPRPAAHAASAADVFGSVPLSQASQGD